MTKVTGVRANLVMNFGQILFGSSLIFVSLIMILYFLLKTVVLKGDINQQNDNSNLNLNLNKSKTDIPTTQKLNSKYRYAKNTFAWNPFYKGKHYKKEDRSGFTWN